MQVVENTPDRLVIHEGRPILVYLLTAAMAFGLWRVFTATEDFESLGQRIFVGVAFAAIGLIAWQGMPSATLILDRRERLVALSHRRLGAPRRVRSFALSELQGATTESRNGRTRRAVLLVDGARIPITPSSTTGYGPRVAAETIEEWLTQPGS